METRRRPISVTQRRILDVIRERVTADGYPPSLREIGAAVGLTSSATVAYQIQRLEARGWIRRTPGQPRSLTILTDPEPDAAVIERLAAEIRRVDPDHAMSWNHLAAALLPWVRDFAAGNDQ